MANVLGLRGGIDDVVNARPLQVPEWKRTRNQLVLDTGQADIAPTPGV